jgi:hypothetical protein
MRTVVEGSVDLPVVVGILSEDVSQEHHLGLQTVFITERSGPVHVYKVDCLYRVIQEELPPLMELNSEDILSKKCHINPGPILNIYRVTLVIVNLLL